MDRLTSLLDQQRTLELRNIAASNAFKAIPGVGMGESGLTPDAVKASAEYQEAQRHWRIAFEALRDFNARHIKEIRLLTSRQK